MNKINKYRAKLISVTITNINFNKSKNYFKEKENNIMKKFVCTVCGYVYEGEAAPAECPICHAPADKFKEQTGEREWAAEHVVGVAKGVSEDILADLRANFEGECSEVGMYLAMARVAHREGYPEVGLYYEKAAWEEAEHAAKFAELLGEVVTDSTKKNLEMRVDARTELQPVSSILQNVQKLLIWMRSMTLFMRWLKMRPVTEELSKDFSRDISDKNNGF